MAKQNSINSDFTVNADGWDMSAGSTSSRKLTVTGSNITVTGLATGFTMVGGSTTPKTLTVDLNLTASTSISVAGTANRITTSGSTSLSVGGTVSTIDIASTYAGQSSIVTVGTITTGTWNGGIIGVTYGGTGANLSATGGAGQYVKQSTVGGAFTVGTIPASDIGSGANLSVGTSLSITAGTGTAAVLTAVTINTIQDIRTTASPQFAALGLGGLAGATNTLSLYGTTSGTVTVKTAAVAGTWTLTVPTTSGTSGQFLQTDGAGVTSWATVAGGITGLANPTALIGLTAINGTATTALRSDAAQALDQAIIPTWTGSHIWAKGVGSGTVTPSMTVTSAAHTPLTASTERHEVNFDFTATETWSPGAITTQRFFVVKAPTANFTAATSSITDAATVAITGAVNQGANALFTNTHALLIQAGATGFPGSAYGLTVNTPTGSGVNVAAQFLGGNVGIGTGAPSGDLAFGGNVARTVIQDRTTTANTAGFNLTVQAGGATLGATDKMGGSLLLAGGIATGTGSSAVAIQTTAPGTAGTTSGFPGTRWQVGGYGTLIHTIIAGTGAVPKGRLFTEGAHTALTLNTERIDVHWNLARTVQWATGSGIGTQRFALYSAPTMSFVGASTVADAAVVAISGAVIAGTNATLTQSHALLIQAGAVGAGVTNSFGICCSAQTGATNNYSAIFPTGNVGIGNSAPGALLDLGLAGTTKGVLRVAGNTSGNVTIQPAAAAGTWSLTLPTTSGTASQFLQTDGTGITTWASSLPSGSFANPTALVALTVVNGTATTAMRSDAAPALDQAIIPTWTGSHTWTKTVGSGTQTPTLTVNGPAHTALTAATESRDIDINLSRTVQWTAGAAISFQRFVYIQSPTMAFTAASTASTAATVSIQGPVIAGTNATITNSIGLIVNVSPSLTTGVTNGIGLRVNAPSGATNNYSAQFFGGNVGIAKSAPTALLHLGELGTVTATLGFAGITSGNVTMTVAAAAGTWTMTLPTTAGTASQFLQTDGAGVTSWSSSLPSGSFANPTGLIGLSVVNGVATTATRSDATHALDQAIVPVWTGGHTFTKTAGTGGQASTITVNGPAHTALTASTEYRDINFVLNRTVEWATGALTTQRFMYVQAPTIAFVGASTVTRTSTVAISGPPIQGTNATLTETIGLHIQTAGAGAATTAVALRVDAPTGATNNYAAAFTGGNVGIGTSAPGALLDLGLAGTTLGLIRLAGNTSGNVSVRVAAAAGTWTMTLPTTAGTSGQFLQTDGAGVTTWATAAGGVTGLANPTATIGLAVVNGAATTAMRSDGAPPLSQAILPTWTGAHVWAQTVASGTVASTLTVTGAAHTALTASTERSDVNWNLARTVQWATGALATQRFILYQAPTISFVGASTVTDTATLAVTGAVVKGTNATVTNTYGVWIQGGAVSTATNAFGLRVAAPTGATNNFAGAFTGGNVGIGNSAPGALLDLGLAGTTLGVLRFAGSTSGNVTMNVAAAAGTWTLTLPTSAGTVDQILRTDGAGITSWVTPTSIAAIRNSAFSGEVETINASQTKAATWGSGSIIAINMLRTGKITGFSVNMLSARTAGTDTFRVTVNGTQSSGAGFDLVINATNTTSNRIVFATPVTYSAGDLVTVTSITDAAWTPIGNAACVSFWSEDT